MEGDKGTLDSRFSPYLSGGEHKCTVLMWDPVQDLTPSGISFNDIMLLVADPTDGSSFSYLRILSPPPQFGSKLM